MPKLQMSTSNPNPSDLQPQRVFLVHLCPCWQTIGRRWEAIKNSSWVKLEPDVCVCVRIKWSLRCWGRSLSEPREKWGQRKSHSSCLLSAIVVLQLLWFWIYTENNRSWCVMCVLADCRCGVQRAVMYLATVLEIIVQFNSASCVAREDFFFFSCMSEYSCNYSSKLGFVFTLTILIVSASLLHLSRFSRTAEPLLELPVVSNHISLFSTLL